MNQGFIELLPKLEFPLPREHFELLKALLSYANFLSPIVVGIFQKCSIFVELNRSLPLLNMLYLELIQIHFCKISSHTLN